MAGVLDSVGAGKAPFKEPDMDDNIVGLAAVVMCLGIPMAAMYTYYRVKRLRTEERLAALARGVNVPMEPELSEMARSRRSGILLVTGALGYIATFGLIARSESEAWIAAALGNYSSGDRPGILPGCVYDPARSANVLKQEGAKNVFRPSIYVLRTPTPVINNLRRHLKNLPFLPIVLTGELCSQKRTRVEEKVLFVDDEPAVLQGYVRLLRNEFKIDTTVTGKGALIALETTGPYAAVVSDMRMPEMTGVEVLRKVKELSPDTVRIMLSGHADLEAAIAAVNEGSIFRFLTKPCDKETLGKTLSAGPNAVSAGTCGARSSRTHTQRQHRGVKRSIESGESCRIWARDAPKALHESHCCLRRVAAALEV